MSLLKAYKDAIVGVVFLVVAGFYYSGTFITRNLLMPAKYGPEFVPRIYLVVFIGLSLFLILSNIRRNWIGRGAGSAIGSAPVEAIAINRVVVFRTVATIALIIGYAAILRRVGFLITSSVYIMLQLLIIAPREKAKPIRLFAFGVIVSVSLYFLFFRFFYLSLPRGILG